jgi:hypothetical protein
VDRTTGLPDTDMVVVRQTGTWTRALGELHQSKPLIFGDHPNGPRRALLYHQFLQYEILEWLGFIYYKGWNVEAEHFEGGFRTSVGYPSAAVAREGHTHTANELDTLFSANSFCPFLTGPAPDIPYSLVTPPHTQLSVLVPAGPMDEGVISFTVRRLPVLGPLCKVTIRTRAYAAGDQLDRYKRLLTLPPGQVAEDKQVQVWFYIVQVETTTDRYRSGNPELPAIDAWARQIGGELRYQLDEELIFKRAEQRGPPSAW